MSDEHDSWFKDAFGVDLGGAAQKIENEAKAALAQVGSTVSQVVQGVQGTVEGALDGVSGAVSGVVKKVVGAAGAVAGPGPAPAAGASGGSGGGTGSFPLGGSVGRGGKNAASDVRAVQGALGIAADGQCGGQTIAAIEAFQKNMGQAKPDGRVDAGGATERAMAGGVKPAPQPQEAPPIAPEGDDLRGLPGVPEGNPASNADAPASDDAAVNDKIKAEFGIQIEAQIAKQGGLVDELNNLEDFKKTEPDPVPEFAGTLDPATLANDIKEKEFSIGQMDIQRNNICKAARADARLASEGAKSDLRSALLGGPAVGGASGIAMVAASMAGGSLALLGVMVAAIIAEHEIFRKYRDTLRTIVNKAHADLTVINTAIAVERKKLEAMKKAAKQPVGDEVPIQPFGRK